MVQGEYDRVSTKSENLEKSLLSIDAGRITLCSIWEK